MHIDFGYLLSNSPGGNLNFESAPFKLTHEYVELLGGDSSPLFRYYRYLLVRGFVEVRCPPARPAPRLHRSPRYVRRLTRARLPSRAVIVRHAAQARRHREKLLLLVQTTLDFGGAGWPCFRAGQGAVDALRARFEPQMSMHQYSNHVIRLVDQAHGSLRTRCYDGYQYCCQGIA